MTALAVRIRQRSFLANGRAASGRAVPAEPLIIDFGHEETSHENGQRTGLPNTKIAKGFRPPLRAKRNYISRQSLCNAGLTACCERRLVTDGRVVFLPLATDRLGVGQTTLKALINIAFSHQRHTVGGSGIKHQATLFRTQEAQLHLGMFAPRPDAP